VPAFCSIADLLTASHVPLQLTISLDPVRLDQAQERALGAARDAILARRSDSALPAHLADTADVWLKVRTGCRLTCAVSSAGPISESFLKLLAGHVFQGPAEVYRRLSTDASESEHGAARPIEGGLLDLRGCIPATGPFPRLFPQPGTLARHGARRFFNRERIDLPGHGAVMGCIREGRDEQTVRLSGRERSRHLYILGATGTGKSTLLYHLAMQDIRSGAGVCLIDPHGDLYHQVRNSIPPDRADDVVLLDPSDRDRAVGINLLDCHGAYREAQVDFVVGEVFAMIEKLYDLKAVGGPVFEQYFRGALQLIMADRGNTGTLADVPLVFEHKSYRDALIARCRPSILADFWKMAESASGDMRLQNLAPYIVSKLNLFVHNATLRPIIGQSRSTVDFRQILDGRHILLVNLSRGALGEVDMRLLGMILLTKFMCAAMSRADIPPRRRTPFMVYVDEFQNFTSDATATLLSESRKFGLCLVLANQNLAQLSARWGHENLVHSVLGNVGSMVLFRLGAPDADRLAPYLRPTFAPPDLQNLPNFHAAARLLSPTGATEPFVFQTHPAPPNTRPHPSLRRRMEANRRRYTASIKAVESEISKHRDGIRRLGADAGLRVSGRVSPSAP
jgi:hypothetical protein